MRSKTILTTLSFFLSAFFTDSALASDSAGEPGRSAGGKNPLNNVYFGEQHLHTEDSPGAFAMGTRNTRTMPATTAKASPSRSPPYDGCATTDRAYLLGLLPQTLDPMSALSKSEIAKLIASGKPEDTRRIKAW